MKVVGKTLIVIGIASYAFAGAAVPTPEIDARSATSALALLTGACFLIWGRKKH